MSETRKENKALARRRRKRLFSYAARERVWLAKSFCATLTTVVGELLSAYLVARTLDVALPLGLEQGRWRSFALHVGAFLALTLLSAAAAYMARLASQSAASHISAHLRDDVFAHVQRLPIRYFDTLPSGKIVSRVTNDTKAVQNYYKIVFSDLGLALAYILVVYAFMLVLNYRLALLMLLPASLLLLIIVDFRKKSFRYSSQFRKTLSELSASVNENLNNMEIIRAFAAEEEVYRRFDGHNRQLYDSVQNLTKLYSYSSYIAIGALRYLTLVVLLIAVAFFNIRGIALISVGSLYLFVDYVSNIFSKSLEASNQLGVLERSNAAADHLFELLELPVEDAAAADYPQPEDILAGAAHEGADPHAALIEFDAVSFSYVEEAEVLHEVSFKVERGQSVAIVGQTGSGKSTLMNLLLRFYDPVSGHIRIAGRDLRSMDRASLRRPMALVPQDSFLFSGTVLENIALNRADIDAERAMAALREVGGAYFLERHPEGLLTEVSQNGAGFSSGEKQLISFARALAQDPAILILDEATAHIDTETESIIQEATRRLLRGRTTLVIAHRLSTIKEADLILVLKNGRVVERGTHGELMAAGGEYADMVERQRVSG